MRCIKSFLLIAALLWSSQAYAEGVLTPAAGGGSGLPAGGTIGECVINTGSGTGEWDTCPGAAGGDSVSVDGVGLVDPDFDSGGDIDFVATGNTVTGNVKANSVALGTDTTGNYAAGDAEAGAALTGDSATSFFPSGTIEDARLPSSMADKVFTGSILIPNATSTPGTCSIGMLFFDNDASAGVNLYGCTASNTWTLLGDGGGAGSVATDTIFDAAGDLVQGTGSNTAARLAIGTASQLLQVNSGATAVEWTSSLTSLTAISFGSNPADAGRLRLSNNESICWEAATPGTDLCLTLNASDEFTLNAPLNLTGTAGPLLLTGVTSPSAPGTAEQWYLYADSVDNLPKYIYNGESEQTFYTTANPQTTITGNAGTATALAANGANCSAGSYPLGVNASGAVESCTSTASDTVTFTNKTLDAEGTGNVITIPRRLWFPAAGCNNATAGSIWDLPTSNPAVAACVTGTNTQKGVLNFADSSNLSAQITYILPTTWTGTVDARIKWYTSATSGDVVWQLSTICVADAETDDPAFNTASTVTDTAKGTTLQTNDAAITIVTVTGCAAGELLHIKIQRDSAHASDTLAATASLIGVELVIREAM